MIVIFYSLWYLFFILYTFYFNIKKFFLKKGIFPKIKIFTAPVSFNSLNFFDKLLLILFYRPNTNLFKKYELYVTDLFNVVVFRKVKYPIIWQFFITFYGYSDLNGIANFNFNNVKKLKKIISKKNSLKKPIIFFTNFILGNNTLHLLNTFILIKLILKLNPFISFNFFTFLKKNNKFLFENQLSIYNSAVRVFFFNTYNNKVLRSFATYSTLYNTPSVLAKDLHTNTTLFKTSVLNDTLLLNNRLSILKKIYDFLKSRNLIVSEINYFWRNSVKDFFIFNKTILIEQTWLTPLKNLWVIKINPSTVSKFLNDETTKNQIIFYIRKNRIFNKGRYSRNRQLYRTGVYWCIWLSILLGYGLYFTLYRFTINFGYFWWITFIGLSIFFFNRSLKYHHYSIKYILLDLNKNVIWVKTIIYSLVIAKKNFLNFFLKKNLNFFLNSTILNNKVHIIFFLLKFFKNTKYVNFASSKYYLEDYFFINLSKEL